MQPRHQACRYITFLLKLYLSYTYLSMQAVKTLSKISYKVYKANTAKREPEFRALEIKNLIDDYLCYLYLPCHSKLTVLS